MAVMGSRPRRTQVSSRLKSTILVCDPCAERVPPLILRVTGPRTACSAALLCDGTAGCCRKTKSSVT